MALYHNHAERRGGFTIIKSHFHCGLLGLLLQLGILTCSWWGQAVATGAACGEEGGCEGGRPPALFSITPACLCSSLHLFLLALWGASVVPVSGQIDSAQNSATNMDCAHRPSAPADLCHKMPPCCSPGKCSVRHPGHFHLALGNFHFLNVFISHVPFVHSLAAWLVMRDRHGRASFSFKQYGVYINTVLWPLRSLAFAQNSSLNMQSSFPRGKLLLLEGANMTLNIQPGREQGQILF